MSALAAFVAGLVFGMGLVLSGMSDPSKVIGFLDLAGRWDPSLAFVMAGAILVGFFAFRLAGRRARTLLGGALHLPQRRDIDRRLVGGSLVFGIGWARRLLSRAGARIPGLARGEGGGLRRRHAARHVSHHSPRSRACLNLTRHGGMLFAASVEEPRGAQSLHE